MGSLGEALPDGIAKVSELIGRMEKQASEFDDMSPGMGDGTRLVVSVMRANRDIAVASLQSNDVVAMIAAYQKLKPAIELAEVDDNDA